MNFKKVIAAALFVCAAFAAQAQDWPPVRPEMHPASRWWWLGSAVDSVNLDALMSEYAAAGITELEITPIYGVQGNDAADIPFLSPEWMHALQVCNSIGDRVGIRIDMNTGTGWPFGGPQVCEEDAATKLVLQDPEAGGQGAVISIGKTGQMVKRAAPGGEGLVIDHFSRTAVANYLDRFTKAFAQSGVRAPYNFFNDSYEVYGADWTPAMFDEFARRRGYRLEDHLDEFFSEERDDVSARIISDYRETMSDLLLENFTEQWTAWAHKMGSLTRNQAHGSPANLIDIYAAVDIPECEGFGLSFFDIDGLRTDSLVRPNQCDRTFMKYSASAAHITGKPLVSSESMTWLTEHFRTSLSQCKPDIDLLFLSGVNHVFFHGTAYSPVDEEWPGWKFYASIDMSPTNSIWKDAPSMFDYITRCQSFLQMGRPDNDLLTYYPIYDVWNDVPGRYLAFEQDRTAGYTPVFKKAVEDILASGYDTDYISDRYLLQCKVAGGLVVSGGTAYKALIVPQCRHIPVEVLARIVKLARKGATVVFVGGYPETVPGYGKLDKRQKRLERILRKLPQIHNSANSRLQRYHRGKIITGSDYASAIALCGIPVEDMSRHGLSFLRRSNPSGHHYFVSVLQHDGYEGWVKLAVPSADVMLFDPMTARKGKAASRTAADGCTEVYLQLRSGESVIIQTFDKPLGDVEDWAYYEKSGQAAEIRLDKGWTLSFVESEPPVEGSFKIDTPSSWTTLNARNAAITMATGRYSNSFVIEPGDADEWLLDLGDVRESAMVRINGKDAGTAWAVPFTLRIGEFLQPGLNTIEVDVTNLPANRIADMDRRGIPWRKFKEINLVDVNYQHTTYGWWAPVPSGLNGAVTIIPLLHFAPAAGN
ncbi:MAG: glycosyl hydrolase family 2 [Bacteroidales bacterium]|nr:glycosyl hydrolase family 2 [Bacteroidales bacterium]